MYENLVEGSYEAFATDWGLKEVEKLKALQAFIVFEFKVNDQVQKLTWSSFLFKTDGGVNKHTADVLSTCGFTGKNITELNNPSALNNKKPYNITVEKNGEYWKVKWVNDPDEAPSTKVSDPKKLAGYDLSKFNAELVKNSQSKPLKNHALDVEETLPF